MRVWYRQLLLLPVLASVAAPAGAVAPVRIAYAGRVVTTPAPVVRFTRGTLVPLRAVTEALGGRVEWDATAKAAVARNEDRTLEVDQQANRLRLDGLPLPGMAAPRTARGHLLVPLSALERLFEVRGRWLPRQNMLRFAAAPGEGPPPATGESPPASAAGVQLRLTLDQRVYRADEPVALTLTVTNPARAPLALQFSSGQRYDFEVRRSGKTVWRWSAGRMFTQALSSLTLGPGERRVFTESWKQQDNEGRPVAPGAYEALATLATMGRPRPQTESLAFRIGS